MVDLHCAMSAGYTVYFAQPDALKGSLAQTLKEVKPTIFLGVPRVWEKMQERMLEIGKSITGFKRTLADWAKDVGLKTGYPNRHKCTDNSHSYAAQKHESGPWGFWIANHLVFKKIREALGFDRLRLGGTAAAPIAKGICVFHDPHLIL